MVRQQQQVVRPAALVDRVFQRLMTKNSPHTVTRGEKMDHTGFSRPLRCSLGQLSEEGVIGNSHPRQKGKLQGI